MINQRKREYSQCRLVCTSLYLIKKDKRMTINNVSFPGFIHVEFITIYLRGKFTFHEVFSQMCLCKFQNLFFSIHLVEMTVNLNKAICFTPHQCIVLSIFQNNTTIFRPILSTNDTCRETICSLSHFSDIYELDLRIEIQKALAMPNQLFSFFDNYKLRNEFVRGSQSCSTASKREINYFSNTLYGDQISRYNYFNFQLLSPSISKWRSVFAKFFAIFFHETTLVEEFESISQKLLILSSLFFKKQSFPVQIAFCHSPGRNYKYINCTYVIESN